MPDDAATMLDQIERLLATRRYEWARPTLEGLHRTITASGLVTLRQQEAVEHIILGRLKHDVG
ncbi:MAG: hypothetical protein Q7J25_12290 [Vicinamibacterales bacterium]|nr:hypothetical protein [Vicinamibacterales bacterium]